MRRALSFTSTESIIQAKPSKNVHEHIITLSSVDQSITRGYIRYCLAFRLDHTRPAIVTARLYAFLYDVLQRFPFLAGHLYPVSPSASQLGRVELRFSEADVDSFCPKVKRLSKDQFPYSYGELHDGCMPPNAFVGDVLHSFPDTPDWTQPVPAFGVQGNFIQGGLLVTFYLQHSVGDGSAMKMILEGGSSNTLCPLEFAAATKTENLARQRLSTSDGIVGSYASHPQLKPETSSQPVPSVSPMSPGTCRVLTFSATSITKLNAELSTYLVTPTPGSQDISYLTSTSILMALLWTAIARAKASFLNDVNNTTTSTLAIPINVRAYIAPPLPNNYFGNCIALVPITLSTSHFLSPPPASNTSSTPYTPSTLILTALSIRRATTAITTPHSTFLRETISLANARHDISTLSIPNLNPQTDTFITSWTDLPCQSVDLGLGLGGAEWARKVSKGQDSYGCVILPRGEGGVWEVMVQLTEEVMERVLGDEQFMWFVCRVVE